MNSDPFFSSLVIQVIRASGPPDLLTYFARFTCSLSTCPSPRHFILALFIPTMHSQHTLTQIRALLSCAFTRQHPYYQHIHSTHFLFFQYSQTSHYPQLSFPITYTTPSPILDSFQHKTQPPFLTFTPLSYPKTQCHNPLAETQTHNPFHQPTSPTSTT